MSAMMALTCPYGSKKSRMNEDESVFMAPLPAASALGKLRLTTDLQ